MSLTDIHSNAAIAAVSRVRNRRGSRHDKLQTATSIVVEGQLIYVDPPRPDIEAALVTQSLVAGEDHEHGYRIVRERSSLLAPKLASPTAGLLPTVLYLALSAGNKPVVRVPRRPLGKMVGTLAIGADTHLVEFAGQHHHGLVRYDASRVDVARLVSQIAAAYPDAKIAIASGSAQRARRFLSRLHPLVPSATLALPSNCPTNPGRVVVGTYFGLGELAVELWQRQIVIALDAEEAASENAQLALLGAPKARLFGLLPTHRQPAPRNRDRIVATFGLEQLTIPAHGYTSRHVEVATLPIMGGPPLSNTLAGMPLLRRGVWLHPIRNRRLAAVAQALVAGDQPRLANLCPVLANTSLPPQRTLVIASGIEQALALAEQLPDWPLVTASDVVVDGLPNHHRRLLVARRAVGGDGTHMIATVAGLDDIDLAAVDAVVWAGAGQHLPPLPAERLICPAGQPHRLLLVDCDDRHHPQLRRWSRFRREQFESAGWFEFDFKNLVARVRRFLSQHPRSLT